MMPSATHTTRLNRWVDWLDPYLRLTRLNKPIGSFLLLWPTLWALWIAADGQPKAHIVVIFVLGVFAMRSAGCIINDYADRNFDAHVERTKDRPLATGELTEKQAIAAFFLLLTFSFSLVCLLKIETIKFSFIALFIACLYPFLKRFTYLPQLLLGVAFSCGIPMAFIEQQGSVGSVGWILLGANLLWVVAYDTLYAMVDREDDLKTGIKSTAILFGKYDLRIVAILEIVSLLMLALLANHLGFNSYYYFGLACALCHLGYQLWLSQDRQRDRLLRAFISNTWFGAFIFIGLVLNYL
ncbi:MAG: 4-hydroxybenzoate polyprenyltransferase [Saprospiraceae bacterium]|jgi:4-hydroxybenzoate polyprenyltransferase